MFKNLTKLEYQRDGKEALEFYIAYLLFPTLFSFFIILLITLFTGMPWGMLFVDSEFSKYLFIFGKVIGIILSFLLSFLIAKKKHLLKHRNVLLLIFASILFPLINGMMLGLVPATYLTIMPTNKAT